MLPPVFRSSECVLAGFPGQCKNPPGQQLVSSIEWIDSRKSLTTFSACPAHVNVYLLVSFHLRAANRSPASRTSATYNIAPLISEWLHLLWAFILD